MGLALLELSKNFFELFDLPVAFAVDAKRLAERYRTLQAVNHCDRLPITAEVERPASIEASNQFHEAYRTLKDPLARAQYLLRIHAGDADMPGDNGKDGAFLMEQMELREILAEAQNRPNPQAAAASVLTQLAEQSAALGKELEGLFADPSAGNLEAAREVVRKLEFLDRCRRDAEVLETALDSGY